MGPWTLFDRDPITGREVWFALDGKLTHWRIDTPVDALLEANAEAEKATHGARLPDWNRVASVPFNVLEKTGLDTAVQMRDDRFLSKWLNDGDNAKFRTSRGKV
jgi:hypothetical protein